MRDALNQVDLAFVVDTTGSMGAFIDAARKQMTDTIRSLTDAASTPIDLRLAIVEYRDHPPQDRTFVARGHPFQTDLARVRKIIAGLKPDGGGDGPEAVYDGLRLACEELEWRAHSRRIAILIGDAPPHGTGGGGDGFRNGCPCGDTWQTITARCEAKGIAVSAVALTRGLEKSFAPLAIFTGGSFFEPGNGDTAIEALGRLLGEEFAAIDFDRQVLEKCQANEAWSVDALSETLAVGRNRIAGSLDRLGRRGLIGSV